MQRLKVVKVSRSTKSINYVSYTVLVVFSPKLINYDRRVAGLVVRENNV